MTRKETIRPVADIPLKETVSLPHREHGKLPVHQYFSPNDKAKRKSRAASHAMEFLSRVFADEGASRFFKTLILRFLFDSSGKSSEDYSRLMPA